MKRIAGGMIAAIMAAQAGFGQTGAAAKAGAVTVRIMDVASGKGALMVSLCDRANFMRRCPNARRVAARRGNAAVTFQGIKPGRYAVMAFHDENGDGQMGRTSIGAPSEGWGFSRDAKGAMSAPTFDQAAINVSANGAIVPVHLTY